MHRSFIFSLVFTGLGLAIIACGGFGAQSTKPIVIIASPPSGSVYSVGEEVVVQSTATDPNGVTLVSLLVDGALVREDPSPVLQGQAQFSLIQSWVAEGVGPHTLTVRAGNSQGATAESGIIINVREQPAIPQPTGIIAIATAVPLLTATPQPPPSTPTSAPTVNPVVTVLVTTTPVQTTTAPPPSAAPPCVLASKFIADVTIPDGTIFTPNAVFTKTWRVQNTGTCVWDNFSLAFIKGTQMAASPNYPVPSTQPGATADLVVPMTAPANYGSYTATWQMRSSGSQLFGTNLTVLINVPAPATVPPPSATPPPTIAGCSGQPDEFSFTASATEIPNGQSVNLAWGAITNASEARLDGGEFNNEGVAAPGNRTVSPGVSTTYTLKAICNNSGQNREHSRTVSIVGNFAGNWNHNFGTMVLAQAGANVNGSYVNGFTAMSQVQGEVTGNELDGTWGADEGTIHFTLGNDGKTFTGNFDDNFQWCGARTGESFPSGCAYDGNWRVKYGAGSAECDMTLNQVGTSVTGTYCGDRTLTGTISYEGTDVVLTGTWRISPVQQGPFKFFLPRYTSSQFRGNYGGNQWCGWRSSSSAPAPCLKN